MPIHPDHQLAGPNSIWQIVRQHDREAARREYLAVTRRQADALITVDSELAVERGQLICSDRRGYGKSAPLRHRTKRIMVARFCEPCSEPPR